MTKKRQIYSQKQLPTPLKELLSDNNIVIHGKAEEREDSMFVYGLDGNTNFTPVDWNKVKTSPTSFIYPEICDWDIPRAMIQRYFGGEGALSPEEGFQGIVLKANTLKITNDYSIGYYSDVISSFASKERVNPVQIRNFTTLCLSYLSYLAKASITAFPIEIDYGLSQNSFFIQIHCQSLKFFIENIVDSTQEAKSRDPFVSLMKEVISKVDLMEVYTLESSQKLVVTACWITNPNFIRTDFYNSLLIHQIQSFRETGRTRFGKIAETKPFFEELKGEQKSRVLESLPKAYSVGESLKERINLVLVKRVVNFLHKKWSDGDGNIQVPDTEDYDLDSLSKDLLVFPDQEAIKRINASEKEAILHNIFSHGINLNEEVERVKENIDTDDYLEGILSSLSKMSCDEANVAIGGFEEDANGIPGQKEDLEKESQMVKGEREDLTEESQMVKGEREDLTEENQMVSGEREEKEHRQVISGGEESQKDEKTTITGTTDNIVSENWEVKRSQVLEKVKGRVNDLRNSKASNKEIDEEVKMIISSELGMDSDSSEKLANAISDDASDDWVQGNLDPINENIKQRIQLEKVSNQLSLRETQVGKMKKLINGLKSEVASLRNEKQMDAMVSTISPRLSQEQESVPAVENTIVMGSPIDDQSDSNETSNSELMKDNEVSAVLNSLGLDNQDETEITNNSSEANASNEENLVRANEITFEREKEKLSNQIRKLEKDNALLLKKFKEGINEISEIRDSGEDLSKLKKENEGLSAQVESLKKRVSFMYDNSKANKEISVSASEVQKIIEDKERFFQEKQESQKELEFAKSENRELERILKQKELEIKDKERLLKNKPTGETEDFVNEKEKEVVALSSELKNKAVELRAATLKTKSFEQKVRFLSAQLDTAKKTSSQPGTKAGGGSGDPKVMGKLKQLEKNNSMLKQSSEKVQAELSEKKTELHKAKLENKTMSLKVKDLEKIISKLTKKAA